MATPPDESRRTFLTAGGKAAAASLLAGALAQPANARPKTGSPRSDDCIRPDRQWQYKRLCRDQIARLEDGDVDAAMRCLLQLHQASPTDPEYLYALAMASAMNYEPLRAADYVQRAVDAGLPFERFLAGPRRLFESLYAHPAFQHLAQRYGRELVHGPLLGCVTDTSARFWVRTWHEVPVRVLVSDSPDFLRPRPTLVLPSAEDRDYTAVTRIDGLTPGTEYFYRVEIDDRLQNPTHAFRTFPAPGRPARFTIGFGGCAGYTPWHERMWRTIARQRFPLFLLTGDNVYIDDPERPAVQQYCYYRRQSRPEFRELVAGTSIAAVWDDHDFGTNDSWGGPATDEPAWKTPVWRTFRNNWNNPAYGGGDAQPGCWFSLSIADVDIFMLDDRYYRDNHDDLPVHRPPTMLGPAQKQWLFDELLRSTATFKLLVTSVPWAYGVKPGSADPWQGFQEERDELFDFLARRRIDGVVLLSGDRHRADIWRIERANGYPLYDFENARLTNLHTHDVLPGAIFGYNEKCTYGRLRFDTTLPDPELTYDILTIDDETVHSFTLRHSEIRHGSRR